MIMFAWRSPDGVVSKGTKQDTFADTLLRGLRPRPARRRVRCGPPSRGLEIESGDSPATRRFAPFLQLD